MRLRDQAAQAAKPSRTVYLSETIAKGAPPPTDGKPYVILYDGEDEKAVKGFGLRVTKNGARAFVLNYRAKGRERRYTIGSYPDWKVTTAREEAKRLKREVDQGRDPMGERHDERAIPTLAELAERYTKEHGATKRERTRAEDQSLLKIILPELGRHKVTDVQRSDVERLHRKITEKGATVRANRALALLSNIFTKASHWGLRADNPAKGIVRNPEERRERYLSQDEMVRFMAALMKHSKKPSAMAAMLLLLTGARRAEVLTATWEQFDLEAGIWTKPSAHTKQKRIHRVPLNARALTLLRQMKAEAEKSKAETMALFPGRGDNAMQNDMKHFWATIRKEAALGDFRLHDLRHTFASVLVSSGLSLPVIGQLLGHTQAATTHRYAHLFDDVLKKATNKVGRHVAAASKQKRAKARAAREIAHV